MGLRCYYKRSMKIVIVNENSNENSNEESVEKGDVIEVV
jgi:hypothetical protein